MTLPTRRMILTAALTIGLSPLAAWAVAAPCWRDATPD